MEGWDCEELAEGWVCEEFVEGWDCEELVVTEEWLVSEELVVWEVFVECEVSVGWSGLVFTFPVGWEEVETEFWLWSVVGGDCSGEVSEAMEEMGVSGEDCSRIIVDEFDCGVEGRVGLSITV